MVIIRENKPSESLYLARGLLINFLSIFSTGAVPSLRPIIGDGKGFFSLWAMPAESQGGDALGRSPVEPLTTLRAFLLPASKKSTGGHHDRISRERGRA